MEQHGALLVIGLMTLSACMVPGASRGQTAAGPSSISRMTYVRVDPPNAAGFAKVVRGEGETHAEGVIDAKGTEIIPPRTSFLVADITGSTALVQNGRVFQFMDLSHGPVSADHLAATRAYAYAEPYRCGRALVMENDRWSYIDSAGASLFDTDFDLAESFHHDRALVMQDGRHRIIDTQGSTVAELPYDQVSPQSPWCWQVTRIGDGIYRSGFVDLNGKEITPIIYEEVGYYDPDVRRIRVGTDGRFGFLDEHAREVIAVRFEQAGVFHHGKARVMLHGRDFLIDPDGNEVAE